VAGQQLEVIDQRVSELNHLKAAIEECPAYGVKSRSAAGVSHCRPSRGARTDQGDKSRAYFSEITSLYVGIL
jgi:hypothetical protein